MASRKWTAHPSVGLALITDLAIVGYGLWTIVSTLTVVAGGSTRSGLTPGVVACVVLGCVLAFCVWKRPAWVAAYVRSAQECQRPQPLELAARPRLALIAAVPAALAVWLATRSLVGLWLIALISYAFATGVGLRQRFATDEEPPAENAFARRDMWIVHALAIACAVFTLLTIRPRSDDPFYLSMSVSVVDYPDAPLLAARTLHGPPTDTLPFQPMFAPYKVHSFETLGGYIAYLTGFDVTAVMHFGLATLFAWLVPFALARLFRWLVPGDWLFALVGTLSYLVIDGSAGRGFANQAFVRMFNGKAALLTWAVPMILYYGLRVGARPTIARVALLALAQIGAMGASSTGIWLAPLLAVLAAAAGTPRAPQVFRSIALGTLSSAYVLAMGAWTFLQMAPQPVEQTPEVAAAAAEVAQAPAVVSFASTQFAQRAFSSALPDVLGGAQASIGLLVMFSLACFIARRVEVFRLLAYLGFTLVGFLANPWLVKLVGRLITGAITYERVFWVLPVPIAVGLFAAQTRQWLATRVSNQIAILLACACLCVFYVASVERTVIGEENHALLRFPPKLKVWPTSRKVAVAVCKLAPSGSIVVAPENVSQQLVTISGCGAPVIAGIRWMQLSRDQRYRRLNLRKYVTFDEPLPLRRQEQMREDLDKYHVTTVVLAPKALKNRAVKAILREKRFKKVKVVAKHHIWIRSLQPASS